MDYIRNTKIIFFWLTILSMASANAIGQSNNNTTLRMVHVLFRHGDRTNDPRTLYPLDPHINETYEPYGIGQLTNKGKRRSYNIGKTLRERYNLFLGSLYKIQDVEAISTDMTRTKMTLLLVLAGLYPPNGTALEWNKELNWQPIVYDYVPLQEEKLLTLSILLCPKYIALHNEYLHSPAGKQTQQKYERLYQYLTIHTGMQVNSTYHVLLIYSALVPESDYGLKLPNWTIPVYPKYMERAVADEYFIFSATTQLKRLSGGFLLKKIINDMEQSINGNLTRKISLYSGHDINIANLLGALDVNFPHIPAYGAYVLVELHEKNEGHCVEIYYQNYFGTEPILLRIPRCQDCCPFSSFVRLLSYNLPRHNDTCG